MPIHFVCKDCGHQLYESGWPKGSTSPDVLPALEVIRLNKGTCPKCGKKLVFNPQDVEVNLLGDGAYSKNLKQEIIKKV